MSTPQPDQLRPPRVFISYSHDSAKHCDRVRQLVERLRRDGIDARLDQFEMSPPQGWPLWCAQGILNANYVLLICTRIYHDRFLGLEAFGKGRGVKWEGKLLQNILYYSEVNAGFIPVLLDDADEAHIPETVREASWYRINPDATQDGGYAQLCGRLSGGVPLPPLEIPKPSDSFRQRDDASVPTEEVWSSSPEISAKIEQIHAKVIHIEQVSVEALDILRKYVPPPSAVERPHNLPPWMPPEIFTGRETELDELYKRLGGGDGQTDTVVPQIIIGGGGCGKSRLAIQAAWILYMQKKCDMAFYVSAAGELNAALAALAEPSLLNLYKDKEQPKELEARRSDVIQALREKTGRWLLLLDAADSEKARDSVKGLLKELAGGRIMITSRRHDWPLGMVHKIPLDVFTLEEARQCLRARYWKQPPSREELEGFTLVATELGQLPLALTIAAGYMNKRRITPQRYLQDWHQKRDVLLDFSSTDLEEENRSLLVAFKLSYVELKAPARAFLSVLCWLAPEPFPRNLVQESESIRSLLAGAAQAAESFDATDAMADLRALSVIQLDEESLTIHKLVLSCAQAVQPETERVATLKFALASMRGSLPATEFDVTSWAMWARLSPHVDALLENVQRFGIQTAEVGLIYRNYGALLFRQARYAAAEPLMRRALAIDEKNFGPDDAKVTTDLSNLAELLKATNRLMEAEPLMRRALEIDEKNLGPDHPYVATDLNNLSVLLQVTNRLIEAEPLMRQALAIDEKNFGPDDSKVARDLDNLAQLFRATNRLMEAEPLMRRALAINEKGRPDHPYVATNLNNLAQLLKATNRLMEAEPLMRRALAIDEKSFGSDHPDVATDLYNLGQLLKTTNRPAEAEQSMRRALLIWLKFTRETDREHPSLRVAFGNYARLLLKIPLQQEEVFKRIHMLGTEAGFDTKSYSKLLQHIAQ